MNRLSTLLRNVLLVAAVAALGFADPQPAQADGCTVLELGGETCIACESGCCWSVTCETSQNGACNLCVWV